MPAPRQGDAVVVNAACLFSVSWLQHILLSLYKPKACVLAALLWTTRQWHLRLTTHEVSRPLLPRGALYSTTKLSCWLWVLTKIGCAYPTSAQGIPSLASRKCALLGVTHSREKNLLLFWDANIFYFIFFYFNQKVAFFWNYSIMREHSYPAWSFLVINLVATMNSPWIYVACKCHIAVWSLQVVLKQSPLGTEVLARGVSGQMHNVCLELISGK